MKYSNLKNYTTAIGVNLLMAICGIGASDCSGDGCMVNLIFLAMIVLSAICYIPYLFIGVRALKMQRNTEVVLFYLPSVLLGVLVFFASRGGIDILELFKLSLFIFVPNVILQMVLERFYSKKRRL